MGVTMEDGAHAITVDRLLEAARSAEGIDVGRLAFHGAADRRVVHDGDPAPGPQARQRRLELHRLVHRLLHEHLDRTLAPRTERAASEPSGEPLDAREPDAADFGGLAIEHGDAGLGQNLADLVLPARFVVVIAEHGDDGHLDGRRQLARENPRFVGQPVVGEVAAEHQDVGGAGDLGKQRLKSTLRVPRDVDVSHRGYSQVRAWRARPFGHEPGVCGFKAGANSTAAAAAAAAAAGGAPASAAGAP